MFEQPPKGSEIALTPLRKFIQEEGFTTLNFLTIASNLAECVLRLHVSRVVHKGIQSNRVYVSPSLSVILAHVGTQVPDGSQDLFLSGSSVRDNLAYMAPEQMGRTGLSVDYRTDIYSLGVVLYELATEHLPHEAEDSAALIHALMAKEVTAPASINVRFPGLLSNLIMKCLAKASEDRYQSAYGLLRDLRRCKEEWMTHQHIDFFPLGEHDVLSFSVAFSGGIRRRKEKETLNTAYERARLGAAEVVWLTGESGIGKTALVESFLSELPQEQVLVATAKCDLNRWGTPYGPVAAALRQLVRHIWTKSSQERAEWSHKVEQSLGKRTSVLMDVIPELELFVPFAQVDDHFDFVASRMKVFHAFRDLVQTCGKSDSPLVVFIDDLQWADPTTLQLLHLLLSDLDVRHVMWIISFRSEEADPLESWLEAVRLAREPMKLLELSLLGLECEDVLALLSEALSESSENLAGFAEYIFQQSKGNPFCIHQLLRNLHDEGELKFNVESGRWQWDFDRLNGQYRAERTPASKMDVLRNLSASDLRVLQWASCTGQTFTTELLLLIADVEPFAVSHALEVSLKEGLLTELIEDGPEVAYSFSHDQVHQACKSTLSLSELQQMHVKIGTVLAERLVLPGFSDGIYDVADHLNVGGEVYQDKWQLAEYNCLAGQRAQSSAAFESALHYFSRGLRYLENEGPETCSDVGFELALGIAQSSFVVGQLKVAETRLLRLLEGPLHRVQRVRVYRSLIRMYTHLLLNQEAFGMVEHALRYLHEKLPSKVSNFNLVLHALALWLKLRSKSSPWLLDLPTVHDEQTHLLLEVLADAAASAFYIDQRLMMWIFLRMLRLTVVQGNSKVAAVAYSNYGMLLCAGFRRYEEGKRFGSIGLDLAERFGDLAVASNTNFIFAIFISPWTQSLHEVKKHLRFGRDYGLSSGDVFTACNSVLFLSLVEFFEGLPLDSVMVSLEEHLALAVRYKNPLSETYLRFLGSVCENLRGGDWKETGDYDVSDPIYVITYGTAQLLALYIDGKFQEAQEVANQIEDAVAVQSMDFFLLSDAFTLQALLLAQRHDAANFSERIRIQRKMAYLERRLKRWARFGHENHRHKYALVKAERARILGRDETAQQYYDLATKEASENGFLHYSAIASELSGKYYMSRGKVSFARSCFSAALDDYQQWGAQGKVREIEEEFALILRRGNGERRRIDRFSVNQVETLPRVVAQNIDVLTVMRAAQLISREVVLENLLQKLILLVLENAGAERVYLFLQKNEELFLEAYASVDESQAKVLHSVPLRDVADSLSATIVDYTFRTQRDIRLDDAIHEGAFVNDPYVVRSKVKSVACIPIFNRQTVMGILYLENNRISHAFSEERLQVLKVFAAQAAISLENAYLYAELEQKVAERTNELEMSKIALEEVNGVLATINEELRQSETIRRDLIANISHDLRTPVTLILGYSEAILQDVVQDGAQIKLFLERIHVKAQGLTRLIGDLFNLVRLESGRTEIQAELCAAQEILLTIVKKYEADVRRAGLNFTWREMHTEFLPQEGARVRVDRDRIDQVFGNLIYNAIQHTQAGGTVSVQLSYRFDSVVFQVLDTGAGIAAENLSFVFERFYKVDKSRSSKSGSGGSGLGLAIAKEIVELHGGAISVASEKGKGSEFSVHLPVEKVYLLSVSQSENSQ